MHKIFYFIFLIPVFLNSQNCRVIQEGSADSSYYDMIEVSNNEFWVGGKNGVLKSFNKEGKIRNIDYPSTGRHILSMARVDSNTIVMAADSGTLYFYYEKEKKWQVNQIKEMKNKSFYRIRVVNDTTIYACGGAPRITYGKRTIPGGFIVKSKDKGKNWEVIYKAIGKMVWDIQYTSLDKRLYACTYSPFGGRIIASDDRDFTSISERFPALIHRFSIQEDFVLIGGRNGNYKKNGLMGSLNECKVNFKKIKKTGLLWDYAFNDNYELMSGNSIIRFKKKEENAWRFYKLKNENRLYKILLFDTNKAWLAGSNQSLYLIEFDGEQYEVLNIQHENKITEN